MFQSRVGVDSESRSLPDFVTSIRLKVTLGSYTVTIFAFFVQASGGGGDSLLEAVRKNAFWGRVSSGSDSQQQIRELFEQAASLTRTGGRSSCT
jgi:hypothetical protein